VIGAVVGLAVSWMGIGLGLEQRRKRRSASQEAPEASAPVAPAVITPPAPPVVAPRATRGRGREASAQPLLLALVVALAAAVLVAFLLQSEAASSAGNQRQPSLALRWKQTGPFERPLH
jgi:hypothetical protein